MTSPPAVLDKLESLDGVAQKMIADTLRDYDETIGQMPAEVLAMCAGPEYVTVMRRSIVTMLNAAFMSGAAAALKGVCLT